MIIKPCADSVSGERLDRKGNALAATDAQGHDTTLQPIPLHGVGEPRRQDRARRPDGMAVGNRAALDVDDVLGEAQLARSPRARWRRRPR